jgi:diphthamide synthase (EF-2-diphthine--ammonia ligase)
MSTMATLGLRSCFPLLKKDAAEHMKAVLTRGFKAYVVCVDSAVLDQSFVGCLVDGEFLNRLPPGVDICGENGEYHTFVVDGPIFTEPVRCQRGSIVHREGFYFCDMVLDN